MRKIQVGLLGLGTVGMGVYKLLRKRAETMDKTIGAQLEIKKILVHNKNKKREADYKTNLNYKSSGWFFLCNLYKNGKTRKRCKRMNDSAFLNSRRTGIFKDMSNGTICIPKDLRDNNGLEKNDRVELIPMQEGIYIRKAYGEKKCQ